jgi:DNA-directed RNA polymerase specialized sigma24 family protein
MVSNGISPTPDRLERRRLFDADQRALRDLFERHRDSVFAAALLVTHDQQVAGVITRRAFAQLWRARAALPSELAPNKSARRWLEATARAGGLAWQHARYGSEPNDREANYEPMSGGAP